jgi:hypothetical protein
MNALQHLDETTVDLAQIGAEIHAALEKLKQANPDSPGVKHWEKLFKKMSSVILRFDQTKTLFDIVHHKAETVDLYKLRNYQLEQELALYRTTPETFTNALLHRADVVAKQMTLDPKKAEAILSALAKPVDS